MVEGAGLDYLLPMSHLLELSARANELSNSNNPILKQMGMALTRALDQALGSANAFRQLRPETPAWMPLLPVCASDPVTVASSPGDPYYVPCKLTFPSLPADKYDLPRRNDIVLNARPFEEFGTTLSLTLDHEGLRSTASPTQPHGSSLYPPMVTVHDGSGTLEYVPGSQADYDFFIVQMPFSTRITLTHPLDTSIQLGVDGNIIQGTDMDLAAGKQHLIMVAGDMQTYQMSVRPLFRRMSGIVVTENGTVDVDLTPSSNDAEFTGKLFYHFDNEVFETDRVRRIAGTAQSIVFEGKGRLNGSGGLAFELTVAHDCPRSVVLEVRQSDGTVLVHADKKTESGKIEIEP